MKNKAWLFVLVSALLLVALFLAFKPKAPAPVLPAAAPTAAAPPARTFELEIQDGKLIAGSPTLKARQGEALTIRIRSDRADELHLHGYDLHTELEANQPATLRFVANQSGRFEFELHKSHVDLGALEVEPR